MTLLTWRACRPAAVLLVVVTALVLTPRGFIGHAQESAGRIDFARDVQPLLKEHCVRCHGPEEQRNGYRLDRRSRAYQGVLRPNIIPGSSATSRLYQKVTGIGAGSRMPPDGPLSAHELGVLQRWIDQGAGWPDALANELDPPPPDERSTQLADAIREHDESAIANLLEHYPGAVKKYASDGSTPLMAAALYGEAALLDRLIALGADPNAANRTGATPLMWALDETEKMSVLLRHGADPNAVSDAQRTPLQMAAAQNGGGEAVRLLLKAGADAKLPALVSAAAAGNLDAVRALLAAGVTDTGDASIAALRGGWMDCLAAISAAQSPPALKNAFLTLLPPIGPGRDDAIRIAVEHGAEINLRGPNGLTPLMRLATSESASAAAVRLLIERGADPRARSEEGFAARADAARLGRTPLVDALSAPGRSRSAVEPDAPRAVVRHNTIDAAVQRSLPLLQRTGVAFYEKSGCVSCHSNLLTAMVVRAARERRFAVDGELARREAETLARDVRNTRDLALQGLVMPGGGPTTTGYILMGLAANGEAAQASTDALTRLLRRAQRPDGRWGVAFRAPSESSEFTAAAVAIRGLGLYGSKAPGSDDRRAIESAVRWLQSATPTTTEDRVFRLFGLVWGDAPQQFTRAAAVQLLDQQRRDGGWAQLASLDSDAYATGSALAALRAAGTAVSSVAYRRGVQFLLNTQRPDGSWFVRKRTHPTQVYFDSGFPHEKNQYISAAATNWATLALLLTRPAAASTDR